MNNRTIIENANRYLMHTYARFPVALLKGRGTRVWSVENREYLDFLSGIAVNNLGHCHPRVVMAIQKQAQRLLHVSNLYHIVPQTELAERLVENSFAEKVFFCNSGAEAVEAAIKLVRLYSRERHGSDHYEIIAAENSFHGRTMAALSATGQEKHRKGFGPMLQGFRFVPYDDIEAMKHAIGSHTCAVLLEPLQGEGGVNLPSPDYLKQVRNLCDEKDVLLILDEVQTGMGRTGKLFAYEYSGTTPDVVALAKGLGGGMAIGALLATDRVAETFAPGSHASTFGGNPLACAAAVATLDTLLEDGVILNNVSRMGDYLTHRLADLRSSYPWMIREIRGQGLLVGMEIGTDGAKLVRTALDMGLLIGTAGSNVLRFCPPLIVGEKEIDDMVEILSRVFAGATVG